MEVHFKFLGEDYWKITKNVYYAPLNGQTTPDEVKEVEHNIRVKEAFLSALTDSDMTNVIGLQAAHVILEKLEILYKGDKQVKVSKLQSLKGKYEMLKMGYDENIHSFMDKVNDLVLGIKCADGTIEEDEIVAKVMRSLPPAYKHKVAGWKDCRI